MTCKSVCSVHAAWYLQRVIHIGRTVPCRRGEGHMGSSQPQTDKRKEQTRQKAKKIRNTQSYTQTQTQPQCPSKKTKKKEQAKQKNKNKKTQKEKKKKKETKQQTTITIWNADKVKSGTQKQRKIMFSDRWRKLVRPYPQTEEVRWVVCLDWVYDQIRAVLSTPLSPFQSWNAITWRAN